MKTNKLSDASEKAIGYDYQKDCAVLNIFKNLDNKEIEYILEEGNDDYDFFCKNYDDAYILLQKN